MKERKKMKHIKKTSFKKFSDLSYVINHMRVKETEKMIIVDNLTYNMIVLSEYLKK